MTQMTASTFDTGFLPSAPRRDAPSVGDAGTAMDTLLDRHDDRLLRDVGIDRETVLGPERTWWRDWFRDRNGWDL